MQQWSPMEDTLLRVGIAMVIGWLSSCLTFFCIGSSVVLYMDPSGMGSGFAIAGFTMIAPASAILGALIAAATAFIIHIASSRELRGKPKTIVVVILLAAIIGLIIGFINLLLFFAW